MRSLDGLQEAVYFQRAEGGRHAEVVMEGEGEREGYIAEGRDRGSLKWRGGSEGHFLRLQ